RPLRSRETIPSPRPAIFVTMFTVWDAACCAVRDRIASQVDLETTNLIAISPTPVAVAAPTLLSAYNPAPRIGLSPILPGSFNETPPVESAAASLHSDQSQELQRYLRLCFGLCSVSVSGFSKNYQERLLPSLVLPVPIDRPALEASSSPLATRTRRQASRHFYRQAKHDQFSP